MHVTTRLKLILALLVCAPASLAVSTGTARADIRWFPTSGCVTDIAGDWAIGCEPTADKGIYHFNRSTNLWVKQSGLATAISVDQAGLPWVVNAEGTIYRWNGTDFEPWDSSKVWSRVAVGNPNTTLEIWAIASDQSIWVNHGTAAVKGAWQHIQGAAVEIAVFQETVSCGAQTIHEPFVVNASDNIFRYLIPSGAGCAGGFFQQTSGLSATPPHTLAPDTLIGQDFQIYKWINSSALWEFEAIEVSPNGTKGIGINPAIAGGLFAFDFNGTPYQAANIVP
jgi:hypothetical protein